jgi:hypothetical protein
MTGRPLKKGYAQVLDVTVPVWVVDDLLAYLRAVSNGELEAMEQDL